MAPKPVGYYSVSKVRTIAVHFPSFFGWVVHPKPSLSSHVLPQFPDVLLKLISVGKWQVFGESMGYMYAVHHPSLSVVCARIGNVSSPHIILIILTQSS